MTNPYVPHMPATDSQLFFGRDQTLREMTAYLQNNQSVSIVGPRKIGKTSLLMQLMRPQTPTEEAAGEDNLFVYLDCEVLGHHTAVEILAEFCRAMIAALNTCGAEPESVLESAAANPSRLAFEDAVRRLNRRGLRVVLILDNFEQLSANPSCTITFLNALRSAAGRFQLVYLTASTRPLIELTYSNRSDEILSSPFFNIFAPQFLGLLDENEARRLIARPMQAADIPVTPALEDFIYDLAGGHPLVLQMAGFHVCEASHDFDQIEQRTLQELKGHFRQEWQSLNPAEQDMLHRLSEFNRLGVSNSTLHAVVRSLVQKCMLIPGDGTYLYPSRAWEEFIAAGEKE